MNDHQYYLVLFALLSRPTGGSQPAAGSRAQNQERIKKATLGRKEPTSRSRAERVCLHNSHSWLAGCTIKAAILDANESYLDSMSAQQAIRLALAGLLSLFPFCAYFLKRKITTIAQSALIFHLNSEPCNWLLCLSVCLPGATTNKVSAHKHKRPQDAQQYSQRGEPACLHDELCRLPLSSSSSTSLSISQPLGPICCACKSKKTCRSNCTSFPIERASLIVVRNGARPGFGA